MDPINAGHQRLQGPTGGPDQRITLKRTPKAAGSCGKLRERIGKLRERSGKQRRATRSNEKQFTID